MPALREWWRGILTAIGQAPWRNTGTAGAQGAGAGAAPVGPSAGAPAPGRSPADDPTYNQLVREAMTNPFGALVMNMLDHNRTEDHARLYRTKIRNCTGCIVVLLLALAGMLILLSALNLTGFWTVFSVISGVMAPVVALSRQLSKLLSETGTATPTLGDDRRAVVPAQRPEPTADDRS
ncbi:hypothetical protein AB0I66_13380 [Streptomyces sp. NPDC050439]|uniref:hypothetical protein n=1 Tax=unclassified Streptomyces TaxID=2593676 RepID=UPI003439D3DF